MALSAEERSEINRRNARNSTGPKTEEGKAKSRQNARKHGLRSEVLALENEDAQAVAEREEAWFSYYKPESPAAQHLATCCVRASLMADRVDRLQAALVNRQIRDARNDLRIAREDEVDALRLRLPREPGAALAGLRRTALGCRYLIDRWTYLRDRLIARKPWSRREIDEAINLQGLRTEIGQYSVNEAVFLTNMFAVLCREDFTRNSREAILFDPDRVPEPLRGVYTVDNHPSPDECRSRLIGLIDLQIAALADEARLRDDRETPELAEAPDRASLVMESVEARLLLRYMSESRTAFRNAFRDLERTLKADAERQQPEPQPASPNEPKSAPKPVEKTASTPQTHARITPAPRPSPPADEPIRSSYVDLPMLPVPPETKRAG